MIITISNSFLDNFPLKNKEYLVDETYYDLPSGQQEYHLYSFLSTLFNNTTILDIGTSNGRSAVALSHNENNKVISYNITDDIKSPNHKIYTKSNIEFCVKNVMEDLTKDFLSNVKLIVLDIDHFETMETIIIKKLDELQFSGILILDDIHHPHPILRDCMQRLWNKLPYRKMDITKYAHFSGTGIVFMNTDIQLILE
jgi:predicted O-methyltransferase YrrM